MYLSLSFVFLALTIGSFLYFIVLTVKVYKQTKKEAKENKKKEIDQNDTKVEELIA